MTIQQSYERFTHSPRWILGALDEFAAARSTKVTVPRILGEVNFYVTRRLTPPVATYDPPLEFISSTNPSGYFLFTGDTRKPDRLGTVTLTAGQYRWRVESEHYQPIEFDDVWPPLVSYDRNKDLKLVPGPTYPFPEFLVDQRDLVITQVRGTLLGAGGAPIRNIPIELTAPVLPNRFKGFLTCSTDERGEWVISFIEVTRPLGVPAPDFPNSRIRVNLPGPAAYDVDLAITPGKENSLKQTALRGRVVKPGGTALSGVRITTSLSPGESFSGADGQWFYYFELRQAGGPVTVTATSSNGLTKDVQTQIVPRATTVVPAIELS